MIKGFSKVLPMSCSALVILGEGRSKMRKTHLLGWRV